LLHHIGGRSLAEAFEQQAVGMFGYMTDLATVDLGTEDLVTVSVSGHDLHSLLYNFLDELLFQFSTELLIFKEVRVTHLDRDTFTITAVGYEQERERERETSCANRLSYVSATTCTARAKCSRRAPNIRKVLRSRPSRTATCRYTRRLNASTSMSYSIFKRTTHDIRVSVVLQIEIYTYPYYG